MTEPSSSTAASAVLDRMRALATRALSEHVNHDGACVHCGRRWPCERVILADHNLAVAVVSANAPGEPTILGVGEDRHGPVTSN